MADPFFDNPNGVVADRARLLAAWAADPDRLIGLTVLLKGTCRLRSDVREFVCSDVSHRAAFSWREGRWQWDLYMSVPALTKKEVHAVVSSYVADVRACYNAGLSKDPGLSGRVEIQFTIGPDGTVPVAVVTESTVTDEVSRCIGRAARRWTFPEPRGAKIVVTYPFVLEPG